MKKCSTNYLWKIIAKCLITNILLLIQVDPVRSMERHDNINRRISLNPHSLSFKPSYTLLRSEQTKPASLIPSSYSHKSEYPITQEIILTQQNITYNIQADKHDKVRYSEQFYEDLVEWYTKGALEEIMQAQFNLGLMYDRGRGVPQSDEKAMYWYTKSANKGDVWAQDGLAYLYEKQNNYEEAIKYYRMASSQNHGFSFCSLGYFYQNGFGVKKDEIKAAEYFEKGKNILECWKKLRGFY
jgi:TPR repeat protein